MYKYLLTGILCLSVLSTEARRKSVYVGFLSGQTGYRTTHEVAIPNKYKYGGGDNIAISFTSEINFDKKDKTLFLSIPIRLHTNRFNVHEQYTSSLYSSYSYSKSYTITSASLGAGVSLNVVPVKSDNIALVSSLSALPVIEAGDFMGGMRANAVGEFYIGMRLMNRLMLGARYVYFFRYYTADDFVVPDRNSYGVSNILFDMRFNLKGSK
jgi:hypothetical protein